MSLDSTLFFYLSTVGYFFGFVFYLLYAVFGSEQKLAQTASNMGITAPAMRGLSWGRLATWVTALSVALATVGVVLRVIELSRASGMFMPLPVSNTYETIVFFSWAIPLVYLFFEWRYGLKALGVFAVGLAFALVAFASSPILPKEATPLVPALQSYWLAAHVSFTLVGEALFSVAFVAGILFLWQHWRGREVVALKRLDEIGYRAIAIGFPFFTLGGLVFGAIWAQKAWGRWWGWDPKETWMLITWLVYALYLHVRVNWGWRDLRTAWLAVIGFAAALFTWLGVNYVLSGLHSYN